MEVTKTEVLAALNLVQGYLEQQQLRSMFIVKPSEMGAYDIEAQDLLKRLRDVITNHQHTRC
jgi:hypothetical protein